MLTGTNMVHVPYHGSAPELTDLIAGQVQVVFEPIQSTIGYIKGGMLRPLATTMVSRAAALPNLPTVGEFVPEFEARTWQDWVLRKARPPKSPIYSIKRSMPFSPIQDSRHGLLTSVSYQCP